MSADDDTGRVSRHSVKPEAPSKERTITGTVLSFVSFDVVPQSSTASTTCEKIDWVCFESCDLNDPFWRSTLRDINGQNPPLLLVIGFASGFQVWAIMSSGEAEELLSIRNGPVKTVKFLFQPLQTESPDKFLDQRPLLAVCDSSNNGVGRQFSSVSVVSFRTGGVVRLLKHNEPVNSLCANRRVLAVTFPRRIVLYDALSFDQKIRIEGCQASDSPDANPIALGSAWLAYADAKLNSVFQSCGGVSGADGQTYAATVMNVAKNLGKNLSALGGQVVSQLGKQQARSVGAKHSAESGQQAAASGVRPGIVTVINVAQFPARQTDVHNTKLPDGIVAHFPAYLDEPIAALTFAPVGNLLLTAGFTGHQFHLFNILPSLSHPAFGAVHHLYTLTRGTTSAFVQCAAFSADCRWCSVTTFNGTTHVYAINPWGGLASVRTHLAQKVVNKTSRFYQSAGLENLDAFRAPPSPPHLSTSPGKGSPPVTKEFHPSVTSLNQASSRCAQNPRLPPFPPPTVVQAVEKKHEHGMIPPILSTAGGAVAEAAPKQERANNAGANARTHDVAFGAVRGWTTLNPGQRREQDHCDSLFVVRCSTGKLTEYSLVVKPPSGNHVVKAAPAEGPIEVSLVPAAQWTLQRSLMDGEVKAPLSGNHPFICAHALLTRMKRRQKSTKSPDGDVQELQTTAQRRNFVGFRQKKCSSWISQVEIVTYSGPHRRLWMGPQFTFKAVVDSNSAELLSPSDSRNHERSDPIQMPLPKMVPVVVGDRVAGSLENLDKTPSLTMEVCSSWNYPEIEIDYRGPKPPDQWLRQNIDEAMQDRPSQAVGNHASAMHIDCIEDLSLPSSVDDRVEQPSSSSSQNRRPFEALRQDSSELLFLEARDSC